MMVLGYRMDSKYKLLIKKYDIEAKT